MEVHALRMPEDASLSSKELGLSSKELGRVASVASEGSFLGKRRRSPPPRVQHTPSLNSYDKAGSTDMFGRCSNVALRSVCGDML